MKYRAFRFLTTDRGKIAALITGIIFLAIVGIGMNQSVSARMLRTDAESTASDWATTLPLVVHDIPEIINGKPASENTRRILEQAVLVGDVYKLRIWDRTGHEVFFFGRMPPRTPKTMAERCGVKGAQAVLNGETCTTLDRGELPYNPKHYACSYIPVRKNGAVIGIMEIYLDQTAHRVIYEKSFLFVEFIIAIAVLLAGGVPAAYVYRKMLAHRAAQEEAQFLAEHDTLTGVANRKRINEIAKAALALSKRTETQVAVLMLDLDHFKDINDGYGHAAGDELLKKFARRISSTIREEDTVARLGGDEFVILQVGAHQPAGAKALADRLLAAFAEPYEICGMQITCGSSIGVAVAPEDATEWERLLSAADAALYKAKAAGRKTACYFHPGMEATIRDRRRMEIDLLRALETETFRLAYQPIFSFRDGTILGFEALIRWPEGQPQRPPEEFIPVAEESGLMPRIGAWVLKTACQTAADWQNPLKISVNLSPVQFRQSDIVETVKEALNSSGLRPERLELEITESLWIENTDAVLDQLDRLKELGVSIALDDFGTGYSSLKYLWKFPFDRVKIDRSFVEEMEVDPKAAAIVNTIVALGRTLDLTVTAEGVETLTQAQILSESGCDHAQGFLLGRPLSASSATALLNGERIFGVQGSSSGKADHDIHNDSNNPVVSN